nr:ATP synthase F0 subunit 8 [Metopina sagittata]
MPQMAPISWLLLFTIFTITFILFNILNYYNFFYSPTSSKKMEKNPLTSLTWKW